MKRADVVALEDDPGFPRPNHLAMTSFVIGFCTLCAQVLFVCVFYCSGPLLMLPTLMGLVTGAYGWRQARLTGVGTDLAAVGLVLGLVNLAISTFWVVLVALYWLFLGIIWVLANLL